MADTIQPISKPSSRAEPEQVNHPPHYGGDTTYEVIKVIEAWGLNFNLGNAVKYIARAGKKGEGMDALLTDLEKARFYLNREIDNLRGGVPGG